MPHVIVKTYPGKTEAQKRALAETIAEAVTAHFGSSEAAISVSIEEYAEADWAEQVYRPDISAKPAALYKKPGYNPF